MGYSIVFETKFVKLPDGRYIHFDRSGCNNDRAGRKRGEFSALGIFTREEIEEKARGYMEASKPHAEGGQFDLKIVSRYASYYDYGKHLLRMLKRAKRYSRFIENRNFSAHYVKEIEILLPEHKVVSLAAFRSIYDECVREVKPLNWRPVCHYYAVDDEKEIVQAIEDGKDLVFYIGKENRYAK